MARLAKYWNKTLILELELTDSYVSGRSSIMEVVAFEAARQEEQTGCRISYLGAFKRFLVMIADIQRLKIRHESFWDQHEINYRQMEQPSVPYVVDPSFPENNYLAGMKPRVMPLFSKFANVTLHRINAWKRGDFQVSIFENQPKWQKSSVKPAKKFKVDSWTMKKVKTYSNYPDIKYREGQGMVSNRDHKDTIDKLNKYIKPVILKAYASGSSSNGRTNGQGTNQPSNEVNEKFDSVYKELQQTISRDINGRQNQTWSLSSGQENHIASVTFPLNDGHNNAIQITFDFE